MVEDGEEEYWQEWLRRSAEVIERLAEGTAPQCRVSGPGHEREGRGCGFTEGSFARGDEVLATGFADQPGRDDIVFGVGAGGEREGEGGVFRRRSCDIALWAFEEDGKDTVGLEANRTFATAGGGAINFGGRFGVGDPGE